MAVSAPRDDNNVPVLMGTSSSDGETPVVLWADPATHRLLTQSSGGGAPADAEYVLLSSDVSLPDARVLTGTANQITITDNGAGSTVVLSLPQNIATSSTPTFASMTLTAASSLTLGTASTNTGAIILKNSTNANNTILQAGAASANLTFTLPTTDGDANDFLQTDGSGVLAWAAPAPGGGDNTALSNLASVAINTALLPDAAAADDFGSATLPFKDYFLAGSSGTPATNNFRITGASTSGTRVITLPDATGTVALTTDIPAAGANTALSNLAAVAINAALVLDTSDAFALGSATKMWSDLFLASGSVINFDNGDVTLTHGANVLTFAGGDLALGANNLTITGSIASTGSRVLKGWFTDLEVTNAIVGSITGNAATVTTNANLTGPITSVGNATAVASQTGTGSVFVMQASPTLTTPVLGVATATSVNGLTITTTTGTLTLVNGSSLVTAGANSITLTSTGATNVTLPTTGTLATLAGTETLTNKRITARVQSVANATPVTPAGDSDDCVDITAIAQAFTIANPTGTPTNFQKLTIRIKDNGTARAITWGDGYVAGGVALPSTTVLSKILTLGFIYNTANALNKWQLVASAQEA